MKIFFLIMIGISLLNADFTKTGDIVTESISKLEFQDDAVGSQMNWKEAISYCESLILEGHNDWRLPNINELRIIISRSKRNPSIVTAFEHTSSNKYWSSTSYERYKDKAWYVNFNYSSVFYEPKDTSYYVRCVKDGQ